MEGKRKDPSRKAQERAIFILALFMIVMHQQQRFGDPSFRQSFKKVYFSFQ